MRGALHIIEVRGDFACFSRPELKVERWSYPCPTPSAARGIFDAIYSKPNRNPSNAEFRWQVTKIELLRPPSYIALRRNEVASKVPSDRTIASWMSGSAEPSPLMADDESQRQQRQTMALREVRYRLHGRILPWPGFERQQAALDEQFRRRASHGKCFMQPCLGCREFVAFFRLVEDPAAEEPPAPYDQNVGWMLYDVFDLSRPGSSADAPSVSLFHAKIRGGVLEVPPFDSPEVRKPGPVGRRAG